MSTTAQDIYRYLHAKVRAPFLCLACGHSELSFAGDTSDGAALTALKLPFGDEFRNPSGYHPFYALVCVKCSYTHFFHQVYVDEWVEKNPATKGVS